jgi:hypothetical protein
MTIRYRVSAGILAATVAGIAMSAASLAGQQATPAPRPAASGGAAKPQAAPPPATTGALKAVTTTYKIKTPDGQPDLQGFWTNATLTPLQRPDGVGEFVTKEEFEKRVAQRAATDEEQTKPGTVNDVHYDFTQFALDKTQSTISNNNYRTSQIIDPADGKIPTLAAARQGGGGGRAGGGAARGGGGGAAGGGAAAAIGGGGAAGGGGGRGGQYDRVQNLPIGTRCIIMGGSGPPLQDAGYNANYQIVQGQGMVMILTEMIHDVRIIPTDNRPAPPAGFTGWMGSSRGHWEGDTLVVETTNWNGRRLYQGSTANMKLTERFVRVAKDQINYRFTVDDPAVFARPWTAEQVLQQTEGPIFEHACHEGNYGVANTLAGARLEEKTAAEKGSK